MAATAPRFAGSFTEAKVEVWTPEHIECIGGFRCSRGEFRSFYKSRIPKEVKAHVGQCWIIVENGKLAGYITLLADRLQRFDKDNNPKKLLKNENIKYITFPAVKIGLLAVDERAKGAGGRLIDWALRHVVSVIAPQLGVRFVTVDALYDNDVSPAYDASTYYARWGFEYVDPEQSLPPANPWHTMFLDIKPLVTALTSKSK